jgi:hypothetical protein
VDDDDFIFVDDPAAAWFVFDFTELVELMTNGAAWRLIGLECF